MDEIHEPVKITGPEPLLTIEEIRQRLEPYYAEKFRGDYKQRLWESRNSAGASVQTHSEFEIIG